MTSFAGVPTIVSVAPKHSCAGSASLYGRSSAQRDDDCDEKCEPSTVHGLNATYSAAASS